jgi:hypothetical protein
MKNKKLNAIQILNKAGFRYGGLKIAKYGNDYNAPSEIQSDQVKAVIEVLVEEINKILEE